jgi:hypothetical protein
VVCVEVCLRAAQTGQTGRQGKFQTLNHWVVASYSYTAHSKPSARTITFSTVRFTRLDRDLNGHCATVLGLHGPKLGSGALRSNTLPRRFIFLKAASVSPFDHPMHDVIAPSLLVVRVQYAFREF